jgi:hypothetical protein
MFFVLACGATRKNTALKYFRNDSKSNGSNSNASPLNPSGKESKITTTVKRQRIMIGHHSSDVGTYRVWQWRGQDGTWNDFTKQANDTIELYGSKARATTFIIDLNGHL